MTVHKLVAAVAVAGGACGSASAQLMLPPQSVAPRAMMPARTMSYGGFAPATYPAPMTVMYPQGTVLPAGYSVPMTYSYPSYSYVVPAGQVVPQAMPQAMPATTTTAPTPMPAADGTAQQPTPDQTPAPAAQPATPAQPAMTTAPATVLPGTVVYPQTTFAQPGVVYGSGFTSSGFTSPGYTTPAGGMFGSTLNSATGFVGNVVRTPVTVGRRLLRR